MDITRLGGIENPHPDGRQWVIAFIPVAIEDDPRIGLTAYADEEDLPGVTEVSHRFVLYEDPEKRPHVVYHSVTLHRHGGDDAGDCETFEASDGAAEVEDIPEDLFDALTDGLDFEIHAPGEEPEEAVPVDPRDLLEPDTDPAGMFQ